MLGQANGQLFNACDEGCRDAFKEDRRAGLNYGLHKKPGGGYYMDREEWSLDTGKCAYCGNQVEDLEKEDD